MASAHTWNGALETAQRIASAGEIDTGSVKGGSFWAQAAEQRLAPLLYTAARTRRGMREVVQWVYGQGGAELDRLTHQLIDQSRSTDERADAQHAYDAHLAFTQLAGETRGSIEGTAQILLSAYRSPTVVRSAEGNQITAQRLLDGANTVYLISDSRRSKLLRPILIGLLTELLDRRVRDREPVSGQEAGAAVAGLPRRARERGPAARTWPRSPPPPPRTTSSSSRSSTTSRKPAAATTTKPSP